MSKLKIQKERRKSIHKDKREIKIVIKKDLSFEG